jgi:NTP pyrophosphatase (non-canonical NTP hydrolase)
VVVLTDIVQKYYEFRKYVAPTPDQALLFLMSEVGELADEQVHTQADWVRNHPEEKGKGRAGEVADVLMMLTAYCIAADLPTPEACLEEKFKSKGFLD